MTYPTNVEFCIHIDSKLKRIGVQHTPRPDKKIFLMQCCNCGSTISTETLRKNKRLYREMLV